MSARRLRLILHGKAAGEPAIRAAVLAARESGIEIDVRATWEAGHAEMFAAEAARLGIDVVIAGGGDGTVNAVMDGLCAGADKPTTALAVMPLGTANDFARSLGFPPNDPLAAIILAAEGQP